MVGGAAADGREGEWEGTDPFCTILLAHVGELLADGVVVACAFAPFRYKQAINREEGGAGREQGAY